MRFRHLLLIMSLACAGAACGGDGGGSPTPTPAPAGATPAEANGLPPTAYPGQVDPSTPLPGYPGEAGTPAP